ncbi:MAG TPA: ABC transporter substrate-binding protein [Candidatus Nitrosotenuis sp.]|nr:ABC transporter substrate-binding protein [Candidatus Nitrosotenuis sp.]
MLKSICQKLIILISLTLTSFAKPTIGIIQIAEHPALDQTRQGIIDQLKKIVPAAQIRWESAQANPATALQIAQKYAGQEMDVIIAIGTPAAQAALSVCKNKDIPVIYASVTDPKAAKLQGNITGVSNFVSTGMVLDKILTLLPNLKVLGVVYNPGEANSEKLVSLMSQDCKERDIQLILKPAYKTSDVMDATQSLISSVDAIIVNSDNTALSAIQSIVNIATSSNIPVLTTDIDTIPQGVMAACGADQYQLGTQVANQAIQIIQGKKVDDIPPEGPLLIRFSINKSSANKLKIKIPESIQQTAELWG